MAEYTQNYNLKKPAEEDFYNVKDFNDNADIIDQALKAHDDALATKETPQGAQEKADAALNSAKQYTDQEVAEVSQALAAHQPDYADLKGYIGYTEGDIYGVEADFVNNKFTRLAGAINKTPGADFDSINAFGGRKRCNLTYDGVVLAYYGEPG